MVCSLSSFQVHWMYRTASPMICSYDVNVVRYLDSSHQFHSKNCLETNTQMRRKKKIERARERKSKTMNWKTTMYIDKVWMQWSAHHHQRKHHPILYVSALTKHSAGRIFSPWSRSSTQEESPQPNTNIIPKSFIHWEAESEKMYKIYFKYNSIKCRFKPRPNTHTLTFLYRNQHSQSWLCIIWHPSPRCTCSTNITHTDAHTRSEHLSIHIEETPQNDIILVNSIFRFPQCILRGKRALF